jgi:hypothetical protein
MKRALRCTATVALALIVHALAGRALAGRDVLHALLQGDRWGTAALLAALVAARAFLYFLAPGWALHIAATAAIQRWQARTPDGR